MINIRIYFISFLLLVASMMSCKVLVNSNYEENRYYLHPGENLENQIYQIFKKNNSHISLIFEKGEYIIDEQIYLNNISNVKILGNGAIIKMKADAVVGNNFGMISFKNSSDIYIENITFDANRDRRKCREVAAHTFMIVSSKRISLLGVNVINSVVDGFIIYTETPEDSYSFCSDISFKNCLSFNSYRNALSIINGRNIRALDCAFSNSNGTAPEGGLVIESDIDRLNSDFRDLLFSNCNFTNNNGWGVIISQKSNPTKIRICDSKIENSGRGGIWNCSVNTELDRNLFRENGEVAIRSVRYEARPIDTINILNNTFRNESVGIEYVGYGGKIESNLFDSINLYGVRLNGITKDDTNAIIDLNQFKNCFNVGISVNRFNSCTISRNKFSGSAQICTEFISSTVSCRENIFQDAKIGLKASYSTIKLSNNHFSSCTKDMQKGESTNIFHDDK
ncbi:MAG TPA: right-handed parallel beta-helix repeat-containing protein [Saprospiraceae bacterium]|nr:right-handed parallel beta-helix repeat-containing protein [Saprospiraceae bacterium]